MGSNKILIVGLVVVVVAAGIYFFFLKGDSGPLLDSTSGGSAMSASAQADRELIQLLQELNSIKLDDSIFSDPVFRSLEDFRVIPQQQPVGRPNPFAPIGT